MPRRFKWRAVRAPRACARSARQCQSPPAAIERARAPAQPLKRAKCMACRAMRGACDASVLNAAHACQRIREMVPRLCRQVAALCRAQKKACYMFRLRGAMPRENMEAQVCYWHDAHAVHARGGCR